MSETNNEFNPDWVSAPGETITEILADRGIPIADLAFDIGYSEDEIAALLRGEMPITSEIAEVLEYITDAPASFWLNREAQYRAGLYKLSLRATKLEAVAAAANDYLDKHAACFDSGGDCTAIETMQYAFQALGEAVKDLEK